MAVDQNGRALFSAKLLRSYSAETREFFKPYHGKTLIEAKRFDPDAAFLKWHHDYRFERV